MINDSVLAVYIPLFFIPLERSFYMANIFAPGGVELVTKSDLDSSTLIWSDNLIDSSNTNISISSNSSPQFPAWANRVVFQFDKSGKYRLNISATNNTAMQKCGFRVWYQGIDSSIIYEIHFDADGKNHQFEFNISDKDAGKKLSLYAGDFGGKGFTTEIITSYKNISLCRATSIIDEISEIKSELKELKKQYKN